MTLREKIIIGVMVLAVLYGALEFFILSPARKARMEAESRHQDLNTFVSGLTMEIAAKNTAGIDRYLVQRATTRWRKDLFFDSPLAALTKTTETTADTKVAEKIPYTYSGYLEMGKKRTAIISGLQYGRGDELQNGDYVVRAIYPNRVILEKKGGKTQIVLPLVEKKL